MARTIAQIQQSIIDEKNSDPTLAGLSSTSNVAIWLLWTYITAVCFWVVENLFDTHKNDVNRIIATQKPHTLQWYVAKAKQFQLGMVLPLDSDTYATIETDPSIMVIQYAAAVELSNMVRIKVATLAGGILSPITDDQLTAFSAYMSTIKDAGVRIQVTSGDPDVLQLSLQVFYDPLVLNNTGARIDGSATAPVKDAVNKMLANLPFNGLFVLNNLIAALQQVEGVVIGSVVSAAANYASLPLTSIPVEYTPDAGYMVLDDTFFEANITYTAHASI